MHTVDVHNQSVRQMYEIAMPKNTDLNENLYEAEEFDVEPVRNGDSFPAMIEKMIAADKEVSKGQLEKLPDESPVKKETGTLNWNKLQGLKEEDESEIPFILPKEQAERSENSLKNVKNGKNSAKKHEAKNNGLNELPQLGDNEKIKNSLDVNFDIKHLASKDLSEKKNGSLLDENKLNSDFEIRKKSAGKKSAALNENLTAFSQLNKNSILQKMNKKEQTQKRETEETGKTKKTLQKQKQALITVEDLRLGRNAQANASIHDAGTEQRVETNNSVDMVIDFRGESQNAFQGASDSLSGNQPETSKTPQSFSAMLAREIKNSSADFVQAGKIVLRDNDAGEIRLQLRPENLGAVKIKLELSGSKKVIGTVIVETKEAFEAFEETVDGLAQEFKQNGFEAADFNLSWSGYSSQDGFAQNSEFTNEIIYKNSGQNLSSSEKIADTLSAYNYVYGSAVNILI